MNKQTKFTNDTKQAFLLSFFPDAAVYAELEVNGFWLVKQFNRNTNSWQVAIYNADSFKRYKDFTSQPSLLERVMESVERENT